MSQTKAQLIDAAATFTISSDASFNSVSIGKGANSVSGNTVLGETALDAAVTGANNTAIGKFALTANTSGFSNTAVGESALADNTTGTLNTGIGLSLIHISEPTRPY